MQLFCWIACDYKNEKKEKAVDNKIILKETKKGKGVRSEESGWTEARYWYVL